MSIALKHIPCPAGDKCTAFQCIFGHANEQAPPVPSFTGQDSGQKSVRVDDQDSSDAPRKRLKVDRDDATNTDHDAPQKLAAKDVQATKGPAKPLTATRPVSPPPLRSHPSTAQTGRATPPSLPPKKTVAAAIGGYKAPKSASPASKKAESLNPRLLKSSPASHETRMKLLRLLHQEFVRLNSDLKKDASDEELRLVLSDQELITRSLDEEQKAAVEKPAVYPNVMKNKVMQHKRMGTAQWKSEREKELQRMQQKPGDSSLSDGPPKKIETGLPRAKEVELLKRIITPIDTLSNHGYVSTVPSEKDIEQARKGVETAKGWEVCDRCRQRFQVFPGRREEDGALTSGGSCNFHWGKTYVPPKAPGDRSRVAKRYQCCGLEVGESVGCITHDYHVYKTTDPGRLAAVLNFAETPANSLAPDDRAVCFDCEMGYTVHGMELIRLTATAWPTGEELLDVLVQPLGEILDLNSRYSGVWPDDLAQAPSWVDAADPTPSKSGEETGSEEGEVRPTKKKLKKVSSPEVARDLLFSLISPSTPLVGHGLENDLNAVRVVHGNVVDTVLLYPHKGGLPYRYGLKKLMQDHLNRKIQQETGPKMLGHDSAEDARAAGDLARLKVMDLWQDMRRAGYKLVDGEIVAPEASGKDGGLTEDFIEK
ncbi:aminopeptidase 2 [Purpureocillium lavendulum]|uniref:Aminopeptidase 2 n=1 Tax=Purpureocillium lavendulum TaxID=1247861 RepID=A0AB34FCL2_9HYPO|nr:aminopeptidase 2 [Purpureocillium lavendulum]